MLDGFAGILLTPEQDSVAASGRAKSQLVEGDGLSTSVQNPLPRRFGEFQCSNGKFRHFKETYVIGHGSYRDHYLGLIVGGAGGFLGNF